MIEAIINAFKLLINPNMIWVIVKAVLLVLVAFVGLWVLLLIMIFMMDLGGVSFMGVDFLSIASWVIGFAAVGSTALVAGLGWMLFPALATATISIFADEIGKITEAEYVPLAGLSRTPSLMEMIRAGLGFFATLALLNLLLLPVYGITMLVFGMGAFLFWGLNSWLIGREYFEMVAMRYLPLEAVKALSKQHRLTIWGFGLILTLMMMMPVIALLMPILGVATMTQLFHKMHKSEFA